MFSLYFPHYINQLFMNSLLVHLHKIISLLVHLKEKRKEGELKNKHTKCCLLISIQRHSPRQSFYGQNTRIRARSLLIHFISCFYSSFFKFLFFPLFLFFIHPWPLVYASTPFNLCYTHFAVTCYPLNIRNSIVLFPRFDFYLLCSSCPLLIPIFLWFSLSPDDK